MLNAGQPVPGIAIGTGWTNRSSGAAWGPWETLTDEAGEFTISNVTPDRAINLYVKMRSLKQLGAISPRKLTTGADGSVLDVGDLNVGVGYTVSGQVVLSTGGPLPAGIWVYMSPEGMTENQRIELPADGVFEFKGVPSWVYSLTVTVQGAGAK